MTKQYYKITLIFISLFSLLAMTGCYIEEPEFKFTNPNGPLPTGNRYSPYYSNNNRRPNQILSQKNIYGSIIIVDAGHGGKDPGAVANGVREKDVTLAVAQKVGLKLQEYGGRVIMTRNSDTFIELDNRAAAAERYKADLLVSIHADYIDRSNIYGATVLVGERASQNSKQIAQSIHNALVAVGIESRGVRAQGLRVCDGHSRPAVLVETGFLSNYQEAQNLTNSWYQSKIANAIADGIANYLMYR